MLGGIGIKEGNLAARGGSLLIRVTEMRLKHGSDNEIVMAPDVRKGENDPIAEEEAEIAAQEAELARRKKLIAEARGLRN